MAAPAARHPPWLGLPSLPSPAHLSPSSGCIAARGRHAPGWPFQAACCRRGPHAAMAPQPPKHAAPVPPRQQPEPEPPHHPEPPQQEQQPGGRLARAADALFSRSRFSQQLVALLAKNVLVAWRSRRSTCLRLLAPFLFLLMALVVNAALNANTALQERFTAVRSAVPSPIGGVPDCRDDLYIAGRPCIAFVWSPNNNSDAAAVVEGVRVHNAPPIPPDQVLGFPTRSAADAWLLAHPDGALGGVHFVPRPGGALDYIVASNSTVKYFKGTFQDPVSFFQLPFVNAVARELARSVVARAAAIAGNSSPDAGGELDWSPRLVRFPHPSLQSTNLLGQVLASFIFASLMFGFVTQMSSLVGERDGGLRLALANMGLRQSAYWVSWMVFDAAMALATALLMVLFGMALQFRFFLANDFSLLLLLFWLFSLAMTSYAYLLSAFVRKPQGAMYLGFAVFIVGWVFQSVIFLVRLPYTPATYYSTTNRWGVPFFYIFSTMPWNPLTKGILDLNEATLTPEDPGIRASQLSSYCSYEPNPALQPPYDPRTEFRTYDCIYPLGQVYVTLLLQWAVYWAAAVYLANVLPNEVGARRPWTYPLSLSHYWRRPAERAAGLRRVLQQEQEGLCQPPPQEGVAVDADVTAEEEKMRCLLAQRASHPSGAAPPASPSHHNQQAPATASTPDNASGGEPYAVELYGLRKVFRGGLRLRPAFMRGCRPRCCAGGVAGCCSGSGADDTDGSLLDAVTAGSSSATAGGGCCSRGEDFWAVRGAWLGIEHGQLFCLLGCNGAGKTTTINCLTGVLPLSGGDALIHGTSIASEEGLDAVRPLMGCCPQFDVLWGELSGAEHLMLAGHIKGLRFSTVRAEAAALLRRVHLEGASGLRSSSYSGGMKRRLSVALALLGDPQVVYLDEPTTGMDPISRRHVWDIINAAKPGRAIVLTTHSMEEADVLGDRIGIMARGRLRALGSSLRLKQKYGSGYKLTLHVALPRSATFSSLAAAEVGALASRVTAVKEFFRERLGLAPSEVSVRAGLLRYLVPPAAVSLAALTSFLTDLEAAGPRLGVTDLQCSLASLEEVFLAIAKQAELEAAAAAGSSLVCVELPDGGGSIMVPLAQEEVTHPDSRITYAVKWAQDDAGRLVVLSVSTKQPGGSSHQQQHEQAAPNGNGVVTAGGIELTTDAAARCDAAPPSSCARRRHHQQ